MNTASEPKMIESGGSLRHWAGRVSSYVLLLICFSAPARGQLYTGSVAGTVLDPSDAAIAGANVTLVDLDRNTSSVTRTDAAGRYLFRSLPPGNYSIKVEAAEFQPFQAQIAIEVNASLTANAKLQLAGAQESVLVSSSSPLLPTEDGTLRQTSRSNANQ